MFTGLIEAVGEVEKFFLNDVGARIKFRCGSDCDFSDVKAGDSIAVNGVCLSVTAVDLPFFEADIMNETLKLTNLKNLKKGNEINLERSLKFNSRLDGHIVSGHIDTIAKVKSIVKEGFSKKIIFACDTDLIVKKGSIAINGVSLTVSDLRKDCFEVSLIPETINNTNLKKIKVGDIVNIEYDLFAKYIKKFFNVSQKKGITIEFLKKNGF